MLISCQHIAREFAHSQKPSSYLVFSEDSLSIDYLGTAHFETEEAKELYKEGILLNLQGNYSEATRKLKDALILEPENYSLLVGLGNIYANEEKLNKALEFYNNAINVSDSIYPGVFLSMAKVYAVQGEFHKARAALEYVTKTGHQEDYVVQVMTYYQLTKVRLALSDCVGAERSFETYENLTIKDDRFNALKNELLKYVINCIGEELREEYRDPETGELLISTEILLLDSELKEKQRVMVITMFQKEVPQNEMVLSKEFFRNYLYTDFYNYSEIAASGITRKRGNSLYVITDLASTKGRNKARISIKLDIEDEYSHMEILDVKYSHPENNSEIQPISPPN